MAKKKLRRTAARQALLGEIHEAGRAFSTAVVMFHAVLAEKLDLSATEWKALDFLDRFGPLTAGELGARSALAPASVTGLVDRLEKKGYARRVKDPKDGRRTVVELAHRRTQASEALFADFLRDFDDLLAKYSDAELRLLRDFLKETARRQQLAAVRLGGAPA
jgi:DNA-binding MarR family transcriptional regulator